MSHIRQSDNPDRRHARSALSLNVTLGTWAASLIVGMYLIVAHSFVDGSRGMIPKCWPAGSKLKLASNQNTLVIFIHPACPCSISSIEQLARIQADCGDHIKFIVVFVWSGGRSRLDASMTYQSAIANPGFECTVDRDTSEARAFGAQTSGHAFLFAPGGRLLFDGGITGARGHAGDNLGQSAIEQWVLRGRSDTVATPIFGCGLMDPSEKNGGGVP